MDEKETGLTQRGTENGAGGFGEVTRLSHDIDSIRSNLDGLIDELGRRRRDAMDVRLQARRHPVTFIVGAVAIAGLVAGAITLAVMQHRRHARLSFRARRAQRNLARLWKSRRAITEPRHEDGVGKKLLAAGGKLAMAVALKRVRGRRRDDGDR